MTVANGLARSRDGMATVTVALDAPGTLWLTILDAVSGRPLPARPRDTGGTTTDRWPRSR